MLDLSIYLFIRLIYPSYLLIDRADQDIDLKDYILLEVIPQRL